MDLVRTRGSALGSNTDRVEGGPILLHLKTRKTLSCSETSAVLVWMLARIEVLHLCEQMGNQEPLKHPQADRALKRREESVNICGFYRRFFSDLAS